MSSGQILGGVIGAVAGYFIPGGGAAMALKGMSLGMTVGGYLDPPKGPTIVGPRLEDLTVQTSTYGSIIPRIYGTIGICGNIFWIENNALKEKVKKSKSGGKGGGGSSTTKTYTYYATFALGLCEGPIVGVRRIWLGSKLWYDAGSDDVNVISSGNANSTLFKLHTGSDTQQPDSRMQATLGVANVPAYRGLAYIVFKDLPLAKYGNSIQGVQAKVEVVKTGNTISLSASSHYFPGNSSYGVGRSAVNTNGLIVTARNAENYFTSTSDGTVFKNINLKYSSGYSTEKFADIASNGKGFCAILDYTNKSVWSINGVTWSGSLLPISAPHYRICASGTRYYVSMHSTNTMLYTDTFQQWSIVYLPLSAGWGPISVMGSIIVICEYGSRARVCVSTNKGLSWQVLTVFSSNIEDITNDGSKFVAVGANSAIYTSYNGVTWVRQTVLTIGNLRAVYYNKLRFIAIGTENTGYAGMSEDGITWTRIPIPGSANGLVFNGAYWVATPLTSSTYVKISEYSIQSTSVSLSSVLSTECVVAGLETTDIDISELSGVVRGYKISSVSAVKSSLIQLQAAFPFDPIQRGYKLKFKPRGGASVVTIPASDLGAVGETV